MTLAEIVRAIESKKRVKKLQLQEQASMDYILADTIGKSVSRIYNTSNKLPDINEIYPTLFDSSYIQEQKVKNRAEISALRFRQFAQSYNSRFNKEVEKH